MPSNDLNYRALGCNLSNFYVIGTFSIRFSGVTETKIIFY